jgi:membrane protein DedA with SNARE-associated domain
MSHTMFHLVARYGYVIVVILVGLEGVGIPLPGETALLTAAALAARGHLSFAGVLVASAIGVALGGMGGYGIGHTAGHAVVVRYGSWIGITEDRLDRTRRFFRDHGAGAVIASRFVPVVRILTGIIAGLTDMPFKRFALYNAIAGVIWSGVIGTAGYAFSRELPRLEGLLGRAGLLILVVVLIVGYVVVHWQISRGGGKGAGPKTDQKTDHRDPPDTEITVPRTGT